MMATAGLPVSASFPLGSAGKPLEAVATMLLWPGRPPGGQELALKLQIEERSPNPDAFHDRVLTGIGHPALHVFSPELPGGAALLIAPGGGYRELAIDAAIAAAKHFASAGITSFVLVYRLPREGWRDSTLVPLQDAMRAMRLVRASAARFNIDSGRVGVLGFSAGGHLAATLATRGDASVYAGIDAVDRESATPAFAALLYPVITMLPPFAHEASREMLLGDVAPRAERAAWACERHVGPGTPPMFLAAAADDPYVAPDNSLLMFAALRRARIPAELHMFEQGGHGFGLGATGQPVSSWPGLLRNWLAFHRFVRD
jgi:acetyl esterase/lipase